jgi:histidinol-phosphate/aromatic aminotransferase/cobyric acid decarboxylase-like protein/choline kinase
MRPLSDTIPKTLLTVGGKTIIGRILDGLHDNGIEQAIIVTGYRAEQLQTYLVQEYSHFRFQFVHNRRYAETNNIYSMALAFQAAPIDDDILLIECDLIYEPSVIRRIIDSPYPNVALVDSWRSGMDGTVVTVSEHIVSSIIPPHLQGRDFDFSDKFKTLNIYKFSRDFCTTIFSKLLTYYAEAIDDNSYYELVLGILIYMRWQTIHAEVLHGEKWAEVDDPNDLRVAEYIFTGHLRGDILNTTLGGYWSHDIVDFSYIRNMYFPTPSMLSEMRNNLPALVQNYGSTQAVLNQKLAYYLLCDETRVHALNGAAQAYPLLREYFADARILRPSPTFGEYARMFPHAGVYSDLGGYTLDDVERALDGVSVVVVVNPNSPTGTTVPTDALHRMVSRHPTTTFLVDESFVDFSGQRSMVDLLEEAPLENVIVLKSLSKSLGVPGLRLGFVYSCHARFNEFVRHSLPIWNMNSIAEYFLEIILKHRKALADSHLRTSADREQLASDLAQVNLVDGVFPSGGNFLLVALKGSRLGAARLIEKLLTDHAIFLKDVSAKFPGTEPFIRVAVRLPDENRRLVELLAEVTAS